MVYGIEMEQEDVPKNKKFMISTRENSNYKWQRHFPDVVFGCLEVPSDPTLNIRGHYNSRPVSGKEDLLDEALELWSEWRLKHEFVQACSTVPEETCCCGLIPDPDTTIKKLVPALNKGWVRDVNSRLVRDRAGFILDAFLWTIHNISGKSEINILLIRFLEEPVGDDSSSSSSCSSTSVSYLIGTGESAEDNVANRQNHHHHHNNNNNRNNHRDNSNNSGTSGGGGRIISEGGGGGDGNDNDDRGGEKKEEEKVEEEQQQ